MPRNDAEQSNNSLIIERLPVTNTLSANRYVAYEEIIVAKDSCDKSKFQNQDDIKHLASSRISKRRTKSFKSLLKSIPQVDGTTCTATTPSKSIVKRNYRKIPNLYSIYYRHRQFALPHLRQWIKCRNRNICKKSNLIHHKRRNLTQRKIKSKQSCETNLRSEVLNNSIDVQQSDKSEGQRSINRIEDHPAESSPRIRKLRIRLARLKTENLNGLENTAVPSTASNLYPTVIVTSVRFSESEAGETLIEALADDQILGNQCQQFWNSGEQITSTDDSTKHSLKKSVNSSSEAVRSISQESIANKFPASAFKDLPSSRSDNSTKPGIDCNSNTQQGIDDIELLTEDRNSTSRYGAKRRRANTYKQFVPFTATLRPKRIPTTCAFHHLSSAGFLAAHKLPATLNKHSLSLEETTANVRLKKRPKTMSLYERRYQSTDDSRGNIGNGYLTTSRHASGINNGLVMTDAIEVQDINSPYYISGSQISSSSNATLSGNCMSHMPSMATLCNIGNTCYLNSVVYTLRFAPHFLHNLHHLVTELSTIQQYVAKAKAKSASLGRGITSATMENARSWSNKDLASTELYNAGGGGGGGGGANSQLLPLLQRSSHELLTEKLHELYQSLYRNEVNESSEPHHADTLLAAIQSVSSIFEGNQQQDAHEFLMCVLNSIRETSQILIKSFVEYPDILLNGYISNPEEIDGPERDGQQTAIVSKASNSVGGNSQSNGTSSLSLTSLTGGKPSLFSRKFKRKEDSKNSKNSRLQSPLKEGVASGGGNGLASGNGSSSGDSLGPSNKASALNTNDLNSLPATSGGGGSGDSEAAAVLAPFLKDKQRLVEKIRELGLDFFSEDFEGITVSTTKCLSCETVTEQKETMIDIAVPVPQSGYESNEFTSRPGSFIQNSCITREYFRNENKYRCEQCIGYTEAIRSISYEVLPRLLVIQLSRFSGGMEKINSYIPTAFTLQCFCSKCCALSDANKLHVYKLYSVITHVGATMSVGHYIAYTCSLERVRDYLNCSKERHKQSSSSQDNSNSGGTGSSQPTQTANSSSTAASNQSSGISSSGSSFIKKMKFGRNKTTNSNSDVNKNVKYLNGLNLGSKAITNGFSKLSMNTAGSAASSNTPQDPASNSSTTCQSLNCCAMRLCTQHQSHFSNSMDNRNEEISGSSYCNGPTTLATGNHQNNNNNNINNNNNNNNNNQHLPYNANSASSMSNSNNSSRGSNKNTFGGPYIPANDAEPVWYMCDDDKIKVMSQREFEELLSPSRKITVTPYLLFYARFDLQAASKQNAGSNTGGGNSAAAGSASVPVTSTKTASNSSVVSPHTSWSSDSLHNSGHTSRLVSGMRL